MQRLCIIAVMLKKIQADVERDYFMSAEEALQYHIIDEIYQPREKK